MRSTTIQMLWIGPRLSVMEQLSIVSFLRNGCGVHLYVYETPEGVPGGATVCDANEILPASRIFQYTGNGSYAGFADFFRYKLLLDRGGWWMDTDLVAVREFDFTDPYVFGSEAVNGVASPTCSVMRAPRGSQVMEYAWDHCQKADPKKLRWGDVGPELIARAIQAKGLGDFVSPPAVFCPVDYPDWASVLEPRPELTLPEETYAVHLWNEMWRQGGATKDARYPETSLYERLKRRYLG